MPDKSLTCVECKQQFPFTEGEQQFYAERQYTEPKRCKPCRDARKAQKEGGMQTHPAPQSYPVQSYEEDTQPRRRRR